ncbi:MAG: efflux RND transporter periplasmic adaptor subunit, partial [Desulfovibrionales bacterium]
MAEGDLSNLKIEKEQYSPARRGGRRNKVIIASLLLAVLTGGVGLYATGILRPATKVDVVTASRLYPYQTFTLLNAGGYVVAQRKAAVASKVTGRLVELSVEEGSSVQAGQVVARLENEDVLAAERRAKANVEVARHNLQQARAELQDARQQYERQSELVAQEIISRSEYDTTKAAYESASAAVQAAEAALIASR